MTEEEKKPLTEAELQIQRLLGLKQKRKDSVEIENAGEGSFVFPEAAKDKPAEKRQKPVTRHKNTLKLDARSYAGLSRLVKKLNASLQGKKLSKDRLASAVISRILADESVFAGADSKEKIEQIIKSLEIRPGGNG